MTKAKGWRSKPYGKITGGQLEGVLAAFSQAWDSRNLFAPHESAEDVWSHVAKLTAVPNWVGFYQRPMLELLAAAAAITGTADQLQQAMKSADAYAAVVDIAANAPDDLPDHPAAIPLAMAIVANLEAVARYSCTVNDMLAALQERGDMEALGKALSIDSAIITLPLCQAMLKYGQLAGDTSIAHDLFNAIKGPHKKRLVYPKLRWAECLLRDRGAFDACTQDEIFELVVVHLKLYGDDTEHRDAKKSLFALFRKWWKEAGIQNAKFSWSAS